ncbi:glycoside hydrolase [uncultured Bacteroides sp.]|uniref:glycoside hydrolase family protein n=1 Tax=uncultured Bacteroides sp. TaxID=162156 RepID=UPI00266FDC3E|nr:glycoside hydrolase [uncultured Bacteroides sp.]
MSIRMVLILVAVCLGYSGATAQEHSHPTPRQLMIPASLFEKAVNCIKGFEGWHSARHHPYIGYGHRLLPGERLTCNLTKEQADSLLRADLIKRCSTFRRFGKDALLLAVLSYNVGEYRLLGFGRIPKSTLIRKLESGNRDIYQEYISYCRYKGRRHAGLLKRRKTEFALFYIP